MTLSTDEALTAIAAHADPEKARGMAAYHKVARPYLGVNLPVLNDLAAGWRRDLTVAERLALAQGLWATNVHEARIAAAKLLTQARIADDLAVWRCLADWVADYDAWAIADHAASAGQRRLLADPARLDEVETWLSREHMWSRRAALVMTLPWAKLAHPSPAQLDQRERILGWAAKLAEDRGWFLQKAVGWWLRDLSKHAPDRVRAFLDRHGSKLKGFARSEATRYLK
jgi:3-methyladenine DNA glycosylase AlkD